jgi:hypothetical protein
MFPIGQIENFKYYQAHEADIQCGKLLMEAANIRNQDFLEANVPQPTPMPITGSFIYAHPPDYRGTPMLNAKTEDWQQILHKLKLQGLDTVIFQAALWAELNECYYESEAFSKFTCWNVIEPMLNAANQEGLRVYLGGYGSVAGWNPDLKISDVEDEIKKHLQCYKELLKWQDKFSGFYFPCETAFKGQRDTTREHIMNCLYGTLFRELKIMAPDKEIMISPASKYFPDMNNDFLDAWNVMLYNVPLDILVPQDSIGCCGTSLADQGHMYQLWRQVACTAGAELWGNIELFERVKFNDPENFVTATTERITAQINNAAPFVQKLVCWEALFFDLNTQNTALVKGQD